MNRGLLISVIGVLVAQLLGAGSSFGLSAPDRSVPAFEINGEVVSVEALERRFPERFHAVQRSWYERVLELAEKAYLQNFWQSVAQENDSSLLAARDAFIRKKLAVTEKEAARALAARGGGEEGEAGLQTALATILRSKIKTFEANLIAAGKQSDRLQLLVPKVGDLQWSGPMLPTDVTLYAGERDYWRPRGCRGQGCPITVVEYSSMNCIHSIEMFGPTSRLLKEYQGKIRWIRRGYVEDEISSVLFTAHRCAAEQQSYWDFHQVYRRRLIGFNTSKMRSLADQAGVADLEEWDACYRSGVRWRRPLRELRSVTAQLEIKGSPTYFVNGQRLEGAVPSSRFVKLFEAALRQSTRVGEQHQKTGNGKRAL